MVLEEDKQGLPALGFRSTGPEIFPQHHKCGAAFYAGAAALPGSPARCISRLVAADSPGASFRSGARSATSPQAMDARARQLLQYNNRVAAREAALHKAHTS